MAIALKSLLSYQLDENKLYDIFEKLFKKRYQFVPDFSVSLTNDLWLPIEVEVNQENTDEFQSFWLSLLEDVYKMKPKKSDFDDFEFELGDKLLQLHFQQPTVKYIWDEVDDDCYVFVDDTKEIKTVSDKTWKQKVKDAQKALEGFQFDEKMFSDLNTENLTLTKFDIDRFGEVLYLTFKYQNLYPVGFIISKNETYHTKNEVKISAIGYCHEDCMLDESSTLFAKIIDITKEQLMPKEDLLIISNKLHLIPVPMELHEELTMLENAVVALINTGNYKYEDIGVLIGKAKKAIDNTVQRIRKKEIDLYKTFLHYGWKK